MSFAIPNKMLVALAACMFALPALAAPGSTTPVKRETRSHPGTVPYGQVIENCKEPNMIALTFDDGPGPYTGTILDILTTKEVKATFFLNAMNTGDMLDESSGRPDNVRRMYAAGHHVASHSYSHKDLDSVLPDVRRDEIVKNEAAFAQVIGVLPTYFRPPYGNCNDACLGLLNELGYHVITWSLDTLDWEKNIPASKKVFADQVQSHQQASYIALSHDIHEGTVKELVGYMIDVAKENGYRLVTVGECLGDPRENWYRPASYV
ncbi:Peptidoglycan/xylan/chitin deacetylase, PgdA/CDA1 family [Geosmithia morbida]|uniref:Peptidoglycan/xylan/chitin deacetylase, PgdA/CDA1 family n=1 Tax=Geosmithia morbida TaxID=1094350 RepID=A0A9P4Z1E4_9HYPO|nr:Peptidoglycan/xylan/chitin deacetylase, PgdA/CDA1 family [Geosmithia morbida]KAF4126923.1 Peptidoglycan/xylan/chitin deacetylase, PgdA/CDA1 family [Geosmithia morbida]